MQKLSAIFKISLVHNDTKIAIHLPCIPHFLLQPVQDKEEQVRLLSNGKLNLVKTAKLD